MRVIDFLNNDAVTLNLFQGIVMKKDAETSSA